jgi:citrate lyase beta subunit
MFTPADRMGALQKAFANRSLDVMVIDMEDAVAGTAEAKQRGRENVHSFISSVSKSELTPNIVIRVNCPHSSPYGVEDLALIQELPNHVVDAVLLPKTDNPINVKATAIQVNKPIWCMIETPKGVQQVNHLAEVDEVDALVFGSNDLTKDLRAVLVPLTREPLLYSMSRTILAARANNKLVIDGVFMNLAADSAAESGLENVCKQGKELGFDGKSLIHPKQLEITNRIFSPTEHELQHSFKVITAYTDAMKEGKGVCVVDGKLIEQLHVDASKEMILKWENINKRRSQ